MRVVVHSDSCALARTAADSAAAALRQAVAARGVAHAMFATGNLQLEFIDTLVTATTDVPWGNVVVFHMDEYVGVGPTPGGFPAVDPGTHQRPRPSPRGSLHRRVGQSPGGVRPLHGAAADHPLDLCCLGIGENGHLAFNDPPSPTSTTLWT